MTTSNPSVISQFDFIIGKITEVTIFGNIAILNQGNAFSVVTTDRKFYGCCPSFSKASKLADMIQLGAKMAFVQK